MVNVRYQRKSLEIYRGIIFGQKINWFKLYTGLHFKKTHKKKSYPERYWKKLLKQDQPDWKMISDIFKKFNATLTSYHW